MFERNIASKLKGWNTISDICEKLGVSKSTAYLYVHKLGKSGFVVQRVKKPRGTIYLIDNIPINYKVNSMLSGTSLLASEIEFSVGKIYPEQKISFLLSEFKKTGNSRYREEAGKLLRSIKNWKRLYRYLKAYDAVDEFKKLYNDSFGKVKKLPSIPKRYKMLR